jgi:uncharacterized protein
VILNSNGILVSPEIAASLAAFSFVTVAVSVDGPAATHDQMRVDHQGHGTFDRVKAGIDCLKAQGVRVGLCCTLARHNLDRAEEILLWLRDTFGVSAVGFNILIETPSWPSNEDYAREVGHKLVACFEVARRAGIYEDRMMRKVKAFVKGNLYAYDCGACGQQLVVGPDGSVGVCQAYWGAGRNFIHPDEHFDPWTHPLWTEWRSRSPLNLPECRGCIALGSCGGGCVFSAEKRTGTIWGLDVNFCEFSRIATTFLVKDLVRVVVQDRTSDMRREVS